MSTGSELSNNSIAELASQSIDQAVVDGLVDGVDRRVHLGTLARVGLNGEVVARSTFGDFRQALADEYRYVDHWGSLYSFNPVLRPESTAKASMIAIVGGTALCSEVERQEVMGFMEQLAQTVLWPEQACRRRVIPTGSKRYP